MHKLSPAELPFSTTNAIQAFCLYSAGVPFHNSKQPLRNEYDIEILKKLGYRGEVNLLDVVKDALTAGKRGRIRYIFQRTKELPKLLKIFADQEKEIDAPATSTDAAAWEAELMQKVAKGDMDPQEAIVRLNCVSLKMNVAFRNIWKELPGQVQIMNPGQPQITDTAKGKVVEYPGWREVPTNCGPKTLRKLKLL